MVNAQCRRMTNAQIGATFPRFLLGDSHSVRVLTDPAGDGWGAAGAGRGGMGRGRWGRGGGAGQGGVGQGGAGQGRAGWGRVGQGGVGQGVPARCSWLLRGGPTQHRLRTVMLGSLTPREPTSRRVRQPLCHQHRIFFQVEKFHILSNSK